MRHVLLYDSADDVRSKAPAWLPGHRAHSERFRSDGSLLLIGPFGDPQNQGSMGVFATRQAAEEFARTDPFVLNGVIRRWRVRDWNEATGGI